VDVLDYRLFFLDEGIVQFPFELHLGSVGPHPLVVVCVVEDVVGVVLCEFQVFLLLEDLLNLDLSPAVKVVKCIIEVNMLVIDLFV